MVAVDNHAYTTEISLLRRTCLAVPNWHIDKSGDKVPVAYRLGKDVSGEYLHNVYGWFSGNRRISRKGLLVMLERVVERLERVESDNSSLKLADETTSEG